MKISTKPIDFELREQKRSFTRDYSKRIKERQRIDRMLVDVIMLLLIATTVAVVVFYVLSFIFFGIMSLLV